MKKIHVELDTSYPIYIGRKFLSGTNIAKFCGKLGHQVVVIADNKVAKIYGEALLNNFKKERIKTHLLNFIANENNKSRIIKEELENKMLSLGCGRDTCIVAFGGGITTDLVGFIAATYYRGIPMVYLPTTLLAMVDASIGGKTGLNTLYGKNLIGAFYQPKAVFAYIGTLETLPKNEIKNGLVEMIKHAIIYDKKYFSCLEKNIDLEEAILTSCKIKKNIVMHDEKDMNIRQILNFGHTIGHALEQVSQYQLKHGEAVALGIIAESYMSFKLHLLSEKVFERIKAIFANNNISTKLGKPYSRRLIKKALLMDKKNLNQSPRFVLIKDVGRVHIGNSGYTSVVTDEIIDQGIDILC